MLLVAFIILSALGLVAVAVGATLMLTHAGKASALSAEEVGEDIVRRQTRDSPGESPLVEGATFRGEGGGVKVEASSTFAGVKADWREGRRRAAAGPLLVLFGIAALLTFGSLALLVGLESMLVGIVLLVSTALTVGRQLVAFVRA